jgi:hypothetical protein
MTILDEGEERMVNRAGTELIKGGTDKAQEPIQAFGS